jgi:hypothetical protein
MLKIIVRSGGILFMVFAGLIVLTGMIGAARECDVLMYVVYRYNAPRLQVLLDLEKAISMSRIADFRSFRVNRDRRIAFAADTDVYIEDKHVHTNITQSPDVDDYPVAWSRDGRLLALFSSFDGGSYRLFVWDGMTMTDVTPGDKNIGDDYDSLVWSHDGRLAFSLSSSSGKEEIYVWDGSRTTNISQNPAGRDQNPVWSDDARLAFFSERDGKIYIMIWQGSGTPVSIEWVFAQYPASLVWTNAGLLAFEAKTRQDYQSQIYVWDGHTASNLSQNSTMHNHSPKWSRDGLWVFSGVSTLSSDTFIFVRDAGNRPVLTLEGRNPVWSSDGHLLFCFRDHNRGWILFLWNRQQLIEIVQGVEIWGWWQNGTSLHCI